MKSEVIENVPSKLIATEVNPAPVLAVEEQPKEGVKETLEPAATGMPQTLTFFRSYCTLCDLFLSLFQSDSNLN